MSSKRITPIISALAFALLAFTPQLTAAQSDSILGSNQRELRVKVINQNWADVRVYVVSSSFSVRLGTVTGLGQATFRVPRAVPFHSGDFQLAIRPIGSRSVYYSQPLLASAGDTVEFRVQNQLGLSSAIVYDR